MVLGCRFLGQAETRPEVFCALTAWVCTKNRASWLSQKLPRSPEVTRPAVSRQCSSTHVLYVPSKCYSCGLSGAPCQMFGFYTGWWHCYAPAFENSLPSCCPRRHFHVELSAGWGSQSQGSLDRIWRVAGGSLWKRDGVPVSLSGKFN